MKEMTIDKKIMTYGAVTLILTLVAIILRTVCLYFSFDSYIGYYKEGFLPSVLGAFCFLSALFFLGALFVVKSDVYTSDGRESNKAIRITSVIAAVAFCYVSIMGISSDAVISRLAISESIEQILSALFVTATAASSVYFIMNVAQLKNKTVHAVFGFGVAIFSVITVVVTYFDLYELLNGPNKITMHMALITCALFMLAEIRAYAGEIKKGYYVFSLTAATFFTGVSGVPSFIFYVTGGNATDYTLYHVLTVGLFLYFVARLVSFILASVEPAPTEEDDCEVSE